MANDQAPSQSRELRPIDEVRHALDRMAPQFKMALPPHVTVEKFVRVVQTAVASNPDLLNCDRTSLYGAAMRCAQDGLLPDGREAAIVKFRVKEKHGNEERWVDKAQMMPMVAGILKKVRQSGELLSIGAHVVYEKEIEQKRFRYILGDDERIDHEPIIEGDKGKPALTYAIAKTKDGGIYREIMTEAQVQAVRNVSRTKDSGPWAGPFADEMRRKTVLRRLSKRLPMSTDVEDTIHRDDSLFEPETPEAKDITPADPPPASSEAEQATGKRRPRALSKVVGQQAQDVEPRQAQQQPVTAGDDDYLGDPPPPNDDVI